MAATMHPSLSMSTIEQSGPRGWIRPLFFFELDKNYSKDALMGLLQEALEKTKQAIPLLRTELIPDLSSDQKGRFALNQGDFGHLYENDLRASKAFSWTFEQLKEKNFPSSALSGGLLCPWGVFPTPGNPIPVFAAQANFIEGGLILSVLIMHLCADAKAIHEVLKIWAQNCRSIQEPASNPSITHLPIEVFTKEAMSRGLPGGPSEKGGKPEHHPEFSVAPAPGPPPAALLADTFRTKTYYISPEKLVQLKAENSPQGGENTWISTNDAVSALVWRCVVSAQNDVDALPEGQKSLNTICVDGRSRCVPPLSPDHIGCPMVYATPVVDLKAIIAADNVAELALTIRKAVQAVDSHYIDSVVTFLNSTPNFDCVGATSFSGLMSTNIMMTAWQRVPIYNINWGPALGYHVKSIRTVFEGFFNGSSVILPFTPDGGLEIVIGLDQAQFAKFDQDKLWNTYAVAR